VLFLQDLGVAPKWCAFLDKVTEEMENTRDQTGTKNVTMNTKYKIYVQLPSSLLC
jgi:hypothetical protein